MNDFSALDRLLHRLALANRAAGETMFDIDQQISQADGAAVASGRHVFVSGLARSGTTLLMRRLHETGAFRSLQYRDMPFVLAPNLWKLVAGQGKADAPRERAHGDGVFVNADSPECLDEVFWRVFCADAYIRPESLCPHSPSTDDINAFRDYVAAILKSADAPAERYLSKNNNNILRLPAIRAAFPNAVILIPFRKPAAHATSLLRQHRRFLDIHEKDEFALSYMRWLAHHEFGADHRPFRFGTESALESDALSIDYWLDLWVRTYSWLNENAPADCVFVSYEALCAETHSWASLERLCGLEGAAPKTLFRAPQRGDAAACNPTLLARAEALYDALRGRAEDAAAGSEAVA